MGSSRWDSRSWSDYSTTASTKSVDKLYTARSAHDVDAALDSAKIKMREARDSVANPMSTPIIIGMDVTGSMQDIPRVMVSSKLGPLIEGIIEHKPVTDPAIMMMAIGDAACDRQPLQITQFESDNALIPQMTKFWLEGGGGGNSYESYSLPWWFAAYRTSTDAFEKRGKKGYLITMGDENPQMMLTAKELEKAFGPGQYQDIDAKSLLEIVSTQWEVFHLMVEQGSFMSYGRSDTVVSNWTNLLGQRAIRLTDYNEISDVITSILRVNEGEKVDSITKGMSSSTAVAVRAAVGSYVPTVMGGSGGIARL